MKTTIAICAAATTMLVAGCSSVPRNTGTSYECNRGTRLKVDYVGDGAIVRVNGGRTMVLKSTPANRGQIYENKSGARLQRNGNEVTWNTALRSAAESCRVVYTPL
ncbi:MAG TPA: MliC family protein [Sphingopyxis sp.]|uniref:MliC family protein n=1 Tax=Sphingopyxis sp. TaxID=1908224 RepID=UPI002CF6614E|nr:MliC family protein [Sphingopyxis sp.]HWW55313.1 MliC family protein [Sphingopyxis sp.]